MTELIIGHLNNIAYIVLMMIGFYAMIGKTNLIKKLIGMNIFQWSIIMFIISQAAKRGAVVPIVSEHHTLEKELSIEAAQYVNPLPHVLMLTAIVVGVATTGVALALLLQIYKRYGTLEENDLLARIQSSDAFGG